VFGNAGGGGAVAELLKKERLRTTKQLKEFCEQRKAEQRLNNTPTQNALHRWVHLHWIPGSFPKELKHIQQKAIQSLYCWESRLMSGYVGTGPVTMWCHGIAFNPKTKVQMRIFDKVAQNPGEYNVEQRKPGWPHERRVSWNIAPLDVQDAPPPQGLAAQSELLAKFQAQSGSFEVKNSLSMWDCAPKPSNKRDDVKEMRCSIKKLFTPVQMAFPSDHQFWEGKYKELESECKAHRVSQCGTRSVKIHNLREAVSRGDYRDVPLTTFLAK